MTCSAIQERMASVLAGGGDRYERLEIESHALRCARCAAAYADLIAMSVALDRAYAPLRSRTVALSPARVRLAVRAPVAVPTSVRVGRLTARFTEVALAAAVTAFAFIGSASVAPKTTIIDDTSTEPAPAVTSALADGATVARWVRIGRYASTPDLVEPPMARPSSQDAPPPEPGLQDRVKLQR
jgi:anti-sigma factor RsiW